MSETTPNPLTKVIGRAWADPAFHHLLLSDPRTALAQEGIQVPQGHTVQVHEDDASTSHLVLPRKPAGLGAHSSGNEQLVCMGLVCMGDLVCMPQTKTASAPPVQDLVCMRGGKP